MMMLRRKKVVDTKKMTKAQARAYREERKRYLKMQAEHAKKTGRYKG